MVQNGAIPTMVHLQYGLSNSTIFDLSLLNLERLQTQILTSHYYLMIKFIHHNNSIQCWLSQKQYKMQT